MPTLAVVVLSYNRRDALVRNLSSMLSSSIGRATRVIVVDNGSSDGSDRAIAGFVDEYPNVSAILLRRNHGVAVGRNEGYRRATEDVILSLDDDGILDPEAWGAALHEFESDPMLGVLAPRVVQAQSGAEQGVHLGHLEELANYHGAGHFIRRSALETVGGLDSGIRFGGEEIDLSMRLREQGFRTLHAPGIVVQHDNLIRVGAEGRERRLLWAYAYGRVFGKNLPARDATILLVRRTVSALYNLNGVPVETGRNPWVQRTQFGASLVAETIRGLRDGRRSYAPLSGSALALYRSADLRPEFGNVPLLQKWRDRQ